MVVGRGGGGGYLISIAFCPFFHSKQLLLYHVAAVKRLPVHRYSVVMPPTSKKLTGHIGFGLSVRQEPCMLGF